MEPKFGAPKPESKIITPVDAEIKNLEEYIPVVEKMIEDRTTYLLDLKKEIIDSQNMIEKMKESNNFHKNTRKRTKKNFLHYYDSNDFGAVNLKIKKTQELIAEVNDFLTNATLLKIRFNGTIEVLKDEVQKSRDHLLNIPKSSLN